MNVTETSVRINECRHLSMLSRPELLSEKAKTTMNRKPYCTLSGRNFLKEYSKMLKSNMRGK